MSNYIEDKQAQDLARRLNNKVFQIRSAFYVWKYLSSLTNTTVVGEEAANKNLALINFHVGFFIPAITSLQTYLIIELHKLFEKKRINESIEALIFPLKKRGRDYTDEFTGLRKAFDSEIKQIEDARHGFFAHKTISKDRFAIPSIKKIDELLLKLAEFLNKVSSEAFGNTWMIPEEKAMQAARDTELVISNLIRGEAARLADIDAEYRNSIFD